MTKQSHEIAASAFGLLAMTFFFSPFLYADEVVLNEEGKIIHGKIIKENDQEVTVRLTGNMFLRVEKTKIKEIIREEKAPVRNTVTMQTIRTSTPAVAAATAPVKPAVTSAIKNVQPDAAKGIQTYVVTGKDFAEVKSAIFSRENGKGFLKKGGRQASQTQLIFGWDGKTRLEGKKTKWAEVVMTSTITITQPEWKVPAAADEASVQAWNEFIAELVEHDQGHVEIYRSALKSLKETLLNVDAANEEALRAASKTIVADWQSRTEKKQEGHDRHEKEKKAEKKAP